MEDKKLKIYDKVLNLQKCAGIQMEAIDKQSLDNTPMHDVAIINTMLSLMHYMEELQVDENHCDPFKEAIFLLQYCCFILKSSDEEIDIIEKVIDFKKIKKSSLTEHKKILN